MSLDTYLRISLSALELTGVQGHVFLLCGEVVSPCKGSSLPVTACTYFMSCVLAYPKALRKTLMP